MAKQTTTENSHTCLHERAWGEVISKQEKMNHDLYGNGKKGIQDTVIELNQSVSTLVVLYEKADKRMDVMCEDINSIKTSVGALVKSQGDMEEWRDEHEAEIKAEKRALTDKEKHTDILKDRKFMRIIAVITTIMVVTQFIVGFVFKFM